MPDLLAVGQWLGTGNRIVHMEYRKHGGWMAVDSTTERYHQRPNFPEGLKTADQPQDCSQLPYTPWPDRPKAGGDDA